MAKKNERDWADSAADKVIANLSDRSGIGNALDECDDEIMDEIRESIAKDIRSMAPKWNHSGAYPVTSC